MWLTLTLLETNAVLNNIQIHKNYNEQSIYIYCDENQIKQVLINLIKNSIESMTDGGNIFVNIYEKDNEVYISILDEGEGIPENSLQKVGEPFFTTKSTGTGLGLSVCFKIIEKHGGKVFITSELKKGTKIVCVFPIVETKRFGCSEARKWISRKLIYLIIEKKGKIVVYCKKKVNILTG